MTQIILGIKMIDTPVKTKLIVFMNGFLDQLSATASDINTILDKPFEKELILKLAKDFASIPFFFDKEREDEYEWLMGFICYHALSCEAINKSVYVTLVNNWGLYEPDTKDSYFLEISNFKKPLETISVVQELVRLNNDGAITDVHYERLRTDVESLLLKYAHQLVLADKNITEDERVKLDQFKQVLHTSRTLKKGVDLGQYLRERLSKIGFRDNELDISRPEDVRNLITKNQTQISAIDRRYVLEFLKIHQYLSGQKEMIDRSIALCKVQKEVSDIDFWIEAIREQIGSYNVVYINSVNLIVCLCENEWVVFYELYQVFDELGVFKTKYEKEVLESLNAIGSEIDSLNKNIVHKLYLIERQLSDISNGITTLHTTMQQNLRAISSLENSIVSGFQAVGDTLDTNFKNLSQNISGHLTRIESGIAYNNLVTTVNAFMLRSINRKAKALIK